MRIAHLIMSMVHGGAERLATDLAYCSMNNGNDVVIISLSSKLGNKGYDNTEKGKKLKIIYIGKKKGLDISGTRRLYKVLSDFNPDIIHTHIDSVVYAIPWFLLHRKAARVHTVHNLAEKEFMFAKRLIMRFAYKTLGIVPVGISDVIMKSIEKEYKLKENKVALIYNGIDTNQFIINKVKSDKLSILHIGRFSPQKNHKLLIEAFFKLTQTINNVQLVLVGEGLLSDEISMYISELEISDKVLMPGATNDVASWYNRADIFVLSSDFEGLPLSILEAFCFGLPVVSTDVGGVSDILKDGINGMLVPPGDVQKFSEALLRMVNDNELRTVIGKTNLKESKAYDISNVCLKYEEFYRKEILRRCPKGM